MTMTRKRIKSSLTDGLDQLYKLTSTYSDSLSNDNKSRTRLAAATAASFLGASIDKLNTRHLTGNDPNHYDDKQKDPGNDVGGGGVNISDGLNDDDDMDTLDAESLLDNEDSQNSRRQKKMNKQDNHFMDILLEKLLLHAMPSNIPDKDEFETIINNPLRKETEPLSISLFTSNIRKSTANLGDFFRFQWFLVKVFNWSSPALTFMFVLCASMVILYPYVLFILPLIHIILKTIIPAYLHRHPIYQTELVGVKPRGDSLLNKFFCQLKDEKLFEQYIDQVNDDKQQERDEMKQRMHEIDDQIDENTKMLRKNMELWVNMRDLQNAMTKMNRMSDNFNKFHYHTAAFKDERATTVLFFKYAAWIFLVLYFGKVVPWKLTLIIFMWFKVLKLHPKISSLYDELRQSSLNTHKADVDKKMVLKPERQDIIIDEPPEIKTVEIFEIYVRSLINSNEWVFIAYSTSEYLPQDTIRKLQKLPQGVSNICSIKPPKTWKFLSESWNIDYDVNKWCEFRNIDVNDKTQALEYKDEYLVDNGFKRRRLWREVIRYSRPVKKAPRTIAD